MNLKYNNKFLYISDSENLKESITKVLEKKNIVPQTESELLSSIQLITNELHKSGKISFLRQGLTDYIKTHGVPAFLVLDLHTETNDTIKDKYIILKTTLLTIIVLNLSRNYENMLFNILIVYDVNTEQTALKIKSSPNSLLSILHTGNDTINKKISNLKNDIKLFNKLFTIDIIKKTDSEKDLLLKIPLFLQTTESKKKIALKLFKQQVGSVSKEKGEPANVYFRNNDYRLLNGEASEASDFFNKLPNGEITIRGLWNSGTNLEVSTKIRKTVKKLRKDREISNSIILNLPDCCKIDGSTAATLTQLTVNDFSSFKVKIHVSAANELILSNSKAYTLVKKHLFRI